MGPQWHQSPLSRPRGVVKAEPRNLKSREISTMHLHGLLLCSLLAQPRLGEFASANSENACTDERSPAGSCRLLISWTIRAGPRDTPSAEAASWPASPSLVIGS